MMFETLRRICRRSNPIRKKRPRVFALRLEIFEERTVPATVSNIVIASPSSSGDNLTIDSSNGDPVPAGRFDL